MAFPMFSRFLFLSMIHLLSTLSLMPRRAPHFLAEKKMGKKIRKPTRLERERFHAKKFCETGAPALETATEAVAPV